MREPCAEPSATKRRQRERGSSGARSRAGSAADHGEQRTGSPCPRDEPQPGAGLDKAVRQAFSSNRAAGEDSSRRGPWRSCAAAAARTCTTRACPSHGSFSARRPVRVVFTTLTIKTSIPRASMNEPIEESRCRQPGAVLVIGVDRRGIPAARMCGGPKVRFIPTNGARKCHFPSSRTAAAKDLRPPVVQAREDPEDRTAEEHVVHVRDDEVRVGHLQSIGNAARKIPESPSDREHRDEPEREQHRRVEDQIPRRWSRSSEDLQPGRTAIVSTRA